MNQEEAFKICQKNQVVRTGHFELNSGRHSANYINKDALFARTQDTYLLCEEIAKRVLEAKVPVDVVAGYPKGGIIMSQWIAFALSILSGKEVLAVYAEYDRGEDAFRRGYSELVRGRNVLAVDDIITSGRTTKQLIEAIKNSRGTLSAIACLWDRSATKNLFGLTKFFPLIQIEFDTWAPFDCPQCKKRVPLDKQLGHGK